jgi:hypothetical protein
MLPYITIHSVVIAPDEKHSTQYLQDLHQRLAKPLKAKTGKNLTTRPRVTMPNFETEGTVPSMSVDVSEPQPLVEVPIMAAAAVDQDMQVNVSDSNSVVVGPHTDMAASIHLNGGQAG